MTQLAHYTCKRCKLDQIDIEVEDRINGTNVPTWLLQVIYPAAMEDHKARSPDCEERFLDIGLRPPDYKLVVIEIPAGARTQ